MDGFAGNLTKLFLMIQLCSKSHFMAFARSNYSVINPAELLSASRADYHAAGRVSLYPKMMSPSSG